jgi:DNA-binding transcriptional MocR family regulator
MGLAGIGVSRHAFVEWPDEPIAMAAIVLPTSPIERPRLSDTIYGQLLDEIMAGRFSAGDRLPTENQLAQRFSVSRPVVREALQRLQTDGVVIARQGSGTYVQRSPSQRVAEPACTKSSRSWNCAWPWKSSPPGLRPAIAPKSRSARSSRQSSS